MVPPSPSRRPSRPAAGVLVARGARAAEEALAAAVEAALAEGGAAALARPVRVVVPSRALRLHVAAALARRRGRAAAGLVVQTLYAAAMEALDRAGVAPRLAGGGGDLAFEVVVRRAARRQRALAERLDALVDGHGAAAATVRDLLDAGFEAVHADAAGEALAAAGREGVPRDEVERARALVAAAVEVERELAALGAERRSAILRRATDLLAADPEGVLPARAVLVHGFADATGVATDFLEALVRHRGATVVVDLPPDPAGGGRTQVPDDREPRDEGERSGAVLTSGDTDGAQRAVLADDEERRDERERATTAGSGDGAGGALRATMAEEGERRGGGGRSVDAGSGSRSAAHSGFGDQPSDEGPPTVGPAATADGGASFSADSAHGQRLRERLAGAAGIAVAPLSAPPPPRLARFAAAGAKAEAREVALRARALLDGGARPEGIGIVARDLAPHRLALRRQLALLGVPFSGLAATGALAAAGRRAQALLDLLRRGRDLPADRWLDAAASLPRPDGRRRRGPFVDLRLAFSSLGAGRLGDVAALDLDRALGDRPYLPLPILRGLVPGRREEEGEAEDEEAREGARPARRTIERGELENAVAAARRLVEALAAWPRQAAAGEHLRRLRALIGRELGWRAGGEADGQRGPAAEASPADPVFAALERLAADLPPGLSLDGEELRLVLGRALDEAGRGPLGGRGGGVQVLGVVEARGRTFDHLFLLGANRNVFPRPVRQDPLLADDLRAALAAVLPDLPRKQAGFDEERHLFAELLSACSEATVSWWSRDDDGKAAAPSPLVERLASAAPAAVAAGLHVLGDARGPRPAAESAVVAALHGAGRDRVRRLLALAIAEERAGDGLDRLLDAAAAESLADARVAVLDEIDPDLRTPEGRATAAALGPYFGAIGRRGAPGDPRGRDLWVTHAENLAACPWQLFLERLLRLEPTPDPLQALPGTDPLLVGNVVHGVLEGLAQDAGVPSGGTLAEALAPGREPPAVPWPPPAELDRRALAAARRALLDEGIALPGLARALAAQARAFLDRAGELDWRPAGGSLAVAAVEAEGEVAVEDAAGRRRRLAFKADRVDLDDGLPRLTDYKTGRPLSTVKSAEKLREHHLRAVREGRSLQATAYRIAGAAAEAGEAVGRYLYLRPDADPRTVELAVGGGDAEFAARFAATARAAFAAWDAGGFFPRVVDPTGEKEPARCSFCRVAEACVRGDSGARRRLHQWATEAGAPAAEAERAILAVWRLHDPAAAEAGEVGAGGEEAR